MFCNAYRESLVEAAAERELTPTLQQHLSVCESCRAAFAEQQSLFAAIDAGLRPVANPEVPATLIPRVHVALNEEPDAQTYSQKWIFAGAALAAVLLVALVLKLNHGTSPPPKENIAVQVPAPPAFQQHESLPLNLSATRAAPRPQKRAETVRLVSRKPESLFTSEVLVPDEERAAFARFLTRDQSAPATVSAVISAIPEAPKVLVPLQPVEIASLKVPSLNGEEASGDGF
jgi:hypothetical protein